MKEWLRALAKLVLLGLGVWLLLVLAATGPARAASSSMMLYWDYPTKDADGQPCRDLRAVWVYGIGNYPSGPILFGSRWVQTTQAGTRDSMRVTPGPLWRGYIFIVSRDNKANPMGNTSEPSNAVRWPMVP